MKQPFYQSPLSGDSVYNCYLSNLGAFGAHWHSEIEILYLVRGSATVVLEDKKYTLCENSAILCGSAEIHEIVTVSPDAKALVIVMGYSLLGNHFRIFTENELPEHVFYFNDSEKKNDALYAVLMKIYDHFNSSHEQNGIFSFRTEALLYDLAVTILESCESIPMSDERRRHIGNFLAMYNCTRYVKEHYSESLDIAFAAELTGYENTRFCQLFKQAMGISFHRYLNEYRIKEAKHLLSETALPVATVGEKVGIRESKTFTRLFKSLCGITPTAYRKNSGKTKK